jgi:aryl-alcohol dehydrogenase-like predicted oxidoreductase
VAQLDAAFDKYGINFIDTAEMYPVPTRAETQVDKTNPMIGGCRWIVTRDTHLHT